MTPRDGLRDALLSGDIGALREFAAELPGFPRIGAEDYMIEAVAAAPPAAVRWMIDNGAPVRIEVDDGFPLLHLAIDRTDSAARKADLVARLIAAGADIDERGANDWTPLMRAAAAGDHEIVALLLGAGADRAARTRIDDFATAEEEMRYLGRLEMADFIRDWRPGKVRR